ncbi:MAG: DUF2079 domain-containing protein [Patescibacteria group bacterium]|nr:DUF2079 domain-containing protein [Patescibacteria group bacterium]
MSAKSFSRTLSVFFKDWWFIIIYLTVYFIVLNLVVLNRFWQFEAYYFDHGIYDQALWNLAHFRAPLIDHVENHLLNQFGDHFDPTILLLIPLYWLTSSYTAILVVQNAIITASAGMLIFLGREIKNKLLLFSTIIAYTLFVGLQNAVISNFHSEFIALLTLGLTFLALERKKWHWYWLFFILTLGTKETFVIFGTVLGIYLILRKNYKQGILTFTYSLAYYFISVKIIMPYLASRPFAYIPNQYSISTMVTQFFYPLVKTDTLALSFLSFSFLPLFSPLFLPVILQDYFIRFVISGTSARLDLGLHYNAIAAFLLVYGSILGIKKLMEMKVYRKIATFHAIGIIFLAIFLHLKLHGPLGLAYNPAFYAHTKDLNFLRTFLTKIPDKGLVMTLNNLAPQLTHTHNVMLLRDKYWQYLPQTIALDLRPGQNPNNFWPLPEGEYKTLFERLKMDPNYTETEITDTQVYFSKKEKVDPGWYTQYK